MPVREINVISILNQVLETTSTLLPTITADLPNVLIDQVYQYWSLKALNEPVRKDGKPSLWGERYKNTLKVELAKGGEGKARVYVDEQHPDYMFVNLVENGVDSWSIKEALLSGKAARRNKALYGTTFVRVPFRYHTPTKQRISSSFTGTMTKDVYEKAKQGVQIGKEYGHFAGLKKYGKGVHSQYMTFRVVSENSKGWIYPNKPATPVYELVKKRVEKMMRDAILSIVQGLSKDLPKLLS